MKSAEWCTVLWSLPSLGNHQTKKKSFLFSNPHSCILLQEQKAEQDTSLGRCLFFLLPELSTAHC